MHVYRKMTNHALCSTRGLRLFPIFPLFTIDNYNF